MEKSCRACSAKVSHRLLFDFGENLKTFMVYKFFFKKIKYFERRLSKNLKKVNIVFLLNLVPFNRQD